MKKLTLYSIYHSIHTINLFQYLSKYWDLSLIAYLDSLKFDKQKLSIYDQIKEQPKIIADLTFAPSIGNYIVSHPFRSLGDLFLSRNQFRKIIFYRRKAISVSKILADIQPDIIYTHQLDAALIAYLCGYKPYVITFWGSDLYQYLDKFKQRKLVRNCIYNAAKIHTMNDEMKQNLIEKFKVSPEKILVQNFGVDVSRFPKNANKKLLKEKYGIKEEFVILSSRFSYNKEIFRLDIIIKAFGKIKEKEPDLDIRLIFINNVLREENLKELADELDLSDKITFTEFLEGNEYVDYLMMSDLAVQCPLHDGVSVSVMESLAAGLPIITTRGTGTEVNVKDNFNGIFLNERNANEIADKILFVLKDKEKLSKLSLNARKWAEEHCQRNKAMKNISELLFSIVRNFEADRVDL
ncbi:MAG: glycosyltransferase family 4 protein [Asgard group archaeon]|nr:glycosyltransferase family 4 protein [Asgard group archaeon]